MKLIQFVSVKLSIFLLLGILLGEYGELTPLLCLGISSFALVFLAYLCFIDRRRHSLLYEILIAISMIGLGAGAISQERHRTFYHQLSPAQLEAPHVWELEIREVLKPTAFYNRYVAEVKTIDNNAASGLILCKIQVDSPIPDIQVDYVLRAVGKALDIATPLNPHQFDYKTYMENQGVYQQIVLKNGGFKIVSTDIRSIAGYAVQLRQHISNKLEAHNFGTDELAIIKALLLGQRSNISSETLDNYKNAGAIHILAVSGLHIGIVLLLLQFLLKPLDYFKQGQNIRLLMSVVLLWGFALLAGFSASVVRAVTMFSFVAYALYLNRPGQSFNILALSMFFILLLINPLLLFQPGFQLSYAAVFSIMLIYPRLQQLWRPRSILLRKPWELFSIGLSAQMGVLPVSLFYFHQFPGLFFVSNMVIVPFLGLILGAGILIIVLAVSGILPPLLASIYNSLIAIMNRVIAWVAQQEAFLFTDIYFDTIFLVLGYTLLILIIWILNHPTPKKLRLIICTIVIMQLWNICHLYQSKRQENLLVIHQIGKTALFYQKGHELQILTNQPEGLDYLVDNYRSAKRVKAVSSGGLKNSYLVGEKSLLIIDNKNIDLKKIKTADIILLTKSVKINLDRLLKESAPDLIIADGSNYRSSIERWRKSCDQYNIPFHNTSEKGALKLNLN